MYHIRGLCPQHDIGGCGFSVLLWPAWKDAVAKSGLTQKAADTVLKTMGREWLDGCGYDQMFDPDNCGFGKENRPPGPNARKMYEPGTSLRVAWGEWGPEHITVPGNACGLDLEMAAIYRPQKGAALLPHNVDTIRQAHLLLVVFTFFADTVILRGTNL